MAEILTATALVEAALALVKRHGFEVWWRGQSLEEWSLVPRVLRDDRGANYEQQAATRFRRMALTRHPKCPSQDDYPSWLYLMQHYGLPTRLLDWTESPLLALFFAVRYNVAHTGALWALAPYKLNARQINEESVLTSADPRAQTLIRAAFDPKIASPRVCVATYPEEVDIRLSVQLSAFTLHGGPTPIEVLPDSGEFLTKFTIPADAKLPLAASLDALGLRLPNLFPDLEHLAADLEAQRF